MTTGFLTLRQKLVYQGVLLDKVEFLEFQEDYIFSSPSTASSIVLGRNSNGLLDWKMKDGKPLKDFESSDKSKSED